MQFELYLESGPQHRKTWVFVLGLPGCTACAVRRPTRRSKARPAAILDRLAFLRRHGEQVADPEPIELVVAEHIIERKWLGFGLQFFTSDRLPLDRRTMFELQLRWGGLVAR